MRSNRILKVLSNRRNNDRDKVDAVRPKMDFEQRIELLLWGDKSLGVSGIKGRLERLEKLIYLLVVLTTLVVLVATDNFVTINEHLTGELAANGGAIRKLLHTIVAGLLGGV